MEATINNIKESIQSLNPHNKDFSNKNLHKLIISKWFDQLIVENKIYGYKIHSLFLYKKKIKVMVIVRKNYFNQEILEFEIKRSSEYDFYKRALEMCCLVLTNGPINCHHLNYNELFDLEEKP